MLGGVRRARQALAVGVLVGLTMVGAGAPALLAQEKKPSVSSGWVKLPAKKPLSENDKVSLTLVTEVGTKLTVDAVVKKE